MANGFPFGELFGFQVALGIHAQENEEQEGESPQGGASVAEEGQWDADDGEESDNHAYVDEYVHKEDAGHRVSVESCEGGALSFGQGNNPGEQRHVEDDEGGASEESPFLAHGAEDEVGLLFGHEVGLGDGAFAPALARQSAAADGYFRLVDVVAGTGWIIFHT